MPPVGFSMDWSLSMKTVLQLEIEHTEPLPESLGPEVEARTYQYIHAKGGRCTDVVAKVIPVLPVREMSDELRS